MEWCKRLGKQEVNTEDADDIQSWKFEVLHPTRKIWKRDRYRLQSLISIIFIAFASFYLSRQDGIFGVIGKLILPLWVTGSFAAVFWNQIWAFCKRYLPVVVSGVGAIVIAGIIFAVPLEDAVRETEPLSRGDVLSFYGDYLAFLGTLMLGYYIHVQDEKRRLEDKRKQIKKLIATLDYCQIELLRLSRNFHENSSGNSEVLHPIQYDSGWQEYYYEYESLKGSKAEIKRTLDQYFMDIDAINHAIDSKNYVLADRLRRTHLDMDNYSMRDYNDMEAAMCLRQACSDCHILRTGSWLENQKTIQEIERLCRDYYPLIENYVYVWLLQHDVTTTDSNDHLDREITDWLIEKSPEIGQIARFPNDRRIVTRVVFDCSCMMRAKSKLVNYVWGEYSLRTEADE